jgi:septum formation protein
MLEPIRHILSRQRNILASSSSRRKEILSCVGLNFECISSNFEENLDKQSFSHPIEYVKENAKQKAISVWKQLMSNGSKSDLIIGCDTVVTLEGVIYEKPKDIEEAIHILTKLSGKTHTVFTGVALVTNVNNTNINTNINTNPLGGDCGPSQPSQQSSSDCSNNSEDYVVTTFHESTDVYITELNESIIKSYVNTGEPMDKAGAYGIQGIGGTIVQSIKGDYYNVMGLPLHRLAKELYHMYIE